MKTGTYNIAVVSLPVLCSLSYNTEKDMPEAWNIKVALS
jgi:hypothetical protein